MNRVNESSERLDLLSDCSICELEVHDIRYHDVIAVLEVTFVPDQRVKPSRPRFHAQEPGNEAKPRLVCK